MGQQKESSRQPRIIGYDFARALAILGMVIVNFKEVMEAGENGPVWLMWLVGLLEGRAAAIFVILAGVGLSLLSRRARLTHDVEMNVQNRNTLLKRALFLFVVGLLYTPVWPADILHFYGIYIAIGAFLLTSSDKRLWQWAASFMIGFVMLLLLFDYEAGWNWKTLDYIDLWTFSGMIRHLFFNGFHPVFPWTAFLIVGMWLGRQDISVSQVRKKLLLYGLGVAIVAEGLSWILVHVFTNGGSVTGVEAEEIQAVLGTKPMPPMPLYLLSAGGTAIVVITLSILLTERYATSKWIQAFVMTGQLALTLYVAHVVLGMGALEAFGRLEKQPLFFAVSSAIIFYLAGIVFSVVWAKRFRRGPLEWVMRRVT